MSASRDSGPVRRALFVPFAALCLLGCGAPSHPDEAAPTATDPAAPVRVVSAAAPASAPPPTPSPAPAPASVAASASASLGTTAPRASERTAPAVAKGSLHLERTIPIGKWPEGVVVLGDVAWVAESGQRRVSRVSLAGEAPQGHVSVGRLPVDIALAPNGKLYTVAKTDHALWEIDPQTSKARVFATVRDYAQSMTIADGGVWILQWLKGTSAASSVVRVDLASRKQTTSPETGANAWAIGFEAGRAWVALGDGSLTSLDGSSLQDVRQVTAPGPPGSARGLVTSHGAVFTDANQQIVRTDVATGLRTHRVTLPEKVALLSASQGAIVVVGARSTIWLLDPATLAIQRELTSSVPWEWPLGWARYGDAFVLTDHGQDGDHGRLHVLSIAPSPPR